MKPCFTKKAPQSGGEAASVVDRELENFMHLAMLNRGILMTPFHNMALMCPKTTENDVDTHAEIFNEVISSITS